MGRLAGLEAKKMMRELDYLKSDLEYKNEIVSDADLKFMNSVNDFLEMYPDLKAVFDNKINERFDKILSVEKKEDTVDVDSVDSYQERQETNVKVRKLYREIVKVTHPDKVVDKRMNQLYMEAVKSYKSDDLIGIYSVCDKVGIDFEIDDEDLLMLKSQIDITKDKISLLESTTTWVWNSTDDDNARRNIILRYVGTQIR